jgi:hypothetical protein
VVDAVLALQVGGPAAHGLGVRHVPELRDLDAAAGGEREELARLGGAAAGGDHARVARCKLARELEADAAVRAGDDWEGGGEGRAAVMRR